MKKDLQKYVDNMPVPPADKVLPQECLKTEGEAGTNVTPISSAKNYRRPLIGGLSAALLVSAAAFTFMVIKPLDSAQEQINESATKTVEAPNKINVSKPGGKDKTESDSKPEYNDGAIGLRERNGSIDGDDAYKEVDMITESEFAPESGKSYGSDVICDTEKSISDSEPKATSSPAVSPADEPAEAAPYDPKTDGEYEILPEPVPDTNIYPDAKAGTLTGGELRDLKNWDNYLHSMDKDILTRWTFCPENRIEVTVFTGDDKPAADLKVALMSGDKKVYEAVTNNEGIAYLFHSYKGNNGNADSYDTIVVSKGDSSESFKASDVVNSKGEAEIKIKEDAVKVSDISKLQIMYVIDTTGSMGDELDYLKAELSDVISRVDEAVAEKGINDVKTSVNFYRDEGDDYVVQYYDFRDDPNEVNEIINKQSADGGGDFPEAVHTALDNAINDHSWAEDGTIKLMFLVLDAPPHDDSEVKEELVKLISAASAKGIRIIPIAASGADEETHQILRAMSVMTGGTYIFLDDNSGVGYSHETPVKDNEYSSEYLNDMMIRIILEYCGIEYEGTKVEKPADPTPQPQ